MGEKDDYNATESSHELREKTKVVWCTWIYVQELGPTNRLFFELGSKPIYTFLGENHIEHNRTYF